MAATYHQRETDSWFLKRMKSSKEPVLKVAKGSCQTADDLFVSSAWAVMADIHSTPDPSATVALNVRKFHSKTQHQLEVISALVRRFFLSFGLEHHAHRGA